ncbi:hypothetical protein J3T91_04705 [Bifidobacterium sp. B4001]|uniref:hypothetical protein n=1 Tax=unclassified Bifidobacterium TaxID=2608897 RepID=UPI00226BBACE|nr:MULTISPECIES: hypothetical protein [unclassified Bifidobacterium]MCX8672813.1 hypothetical protein [Bifidobacterium sp. B4079]MCX8681246.1 hypothetical protein [Bifidobacterium sp. B4001]
MGNEEEETKRLENLFFPFNININDWYKREEKENMAGKLWAPYFLDLLRRSIYDGCSIPAAKKRIEKSILNDWQVGIFGEIELRMDEFQNALNSIQEFEPLNVRIGYRANKGEVPTLFLNHPRIEELLRPFEQRLTDFRFDQFALQEGSVPD